MDDDPGPGLKVIVVGEGETTFEDWEWGEPPASLTEMHEASCQQGAEVLLRQIAEDAELYLGCDDDGRLTISLDCTGMDLQIVGHPNAYHEGHFYVGGDIADGQPDKIVGALRQLADKMELDWAAFLDERKAYLQTIIDQAKNQPVVPTI
jgi:hypothetical protein